MNFTQNTTELQEIELIREVDVLNRLDSIKSQLEIFHAIDTSMIKHDSGSISYFIDSIISQIELLSNRISKSIHHD